MVKKLKLKLNLIFIMIKLLEKIIAKSGYNIKGVYYISSSFCKILGVKNLILSFFSFPKKNKKTKMTSITSKQVLLPFYKGFEEIETGKLS